MLAWIDDYEGNYHRATQRCAALLGSNGAPGIATSELRIEAGTWHRWGRADVERGFLLLQRSNHDRDGRRLIRRGMRSLKTAAKLSETNDRRAGRAENPFHRLWLARAALLKGDERAPYLLSEQREIANELDGIRPHVVFINARDRRLRGLRPSLEDLEAIDAALAYWEHRSYKRGGCELLFERAEMLRSRGSKAQAVDALILCSELGKQLRHPSLSAARSRLMAMRADYDAPVLQERAHELMQSDDYRGFFRRFAFNDCPRQVTCPEER